MKPKVTTVEVPDLGVVGIRAMTGAELEAFNASNTNDKGETVVRQFRNRLVVRTVCDEHGQRLFADSDIDAVGELPFTVLKTLTDAASKANGLTADDEAELVKN